MDEIKLYKDEQKILEFFERDEWKSVQNEDQSSIKYRNQRLRKYWPIRI